MRGEVRRCQKHTRHYSPLVASFGTLHCTVPCSPPTYDLRSCRDTNYTIFAHKKAELLSRAPQSAQQILKILWLVVLTCFNHLGKILVNGKDFPRLVENKKCLKPPASLKSVAGTMAIHDTLRTRRTVWTNDDTKTKSCHLPTAARKSAHV